MSVELLRLRRGTSEQNSRAIERKVRSIMTTFTELDMHYEVERKSRTNIVLAPTFDEPMADFEYGFELLKDQLSTPQNEDLFADSPSTQENLSDLRSGGTPRPRGLR